jgi:hypothetical protein
MDFVWGLQPAILLLHMLNVGLYIHVALRDGVNPFTRL